MSAVFVFTWGDAVLLAVLAIVAVLSGAAAACKWLDDRREARRARKGRAP